MVLDELIISRLHDSMGVNAATVEQHTPLIAHASKMLLDCLVTEHKIICCANGASSALAQHFTTLMMNRFQHERPGLPVINLGSDGNIQSAICEDSSFMDSHAKPIYALGQANDILLLITTHGRSGSLIQAIQAAHERGMSVIILNGIDGGDITSLLSKEEVEIRVPSNNPIMIHHAQLLILHTLCDLIDHQLFGNYP